MCCSPMCACCIQEEDEVPDDETVNQMIARSEEEFDQFMVSNFKIPQSLLESQAADVVQPLWDFFCFSCSFSVWTWTGDVKKPATRGANRAWWRRTSCPLGSWRTMPRLNGWRARRRRRKCSAEVLGREKRWTTAIRWLKSSGWRLFDRTDITAENENGPFLV